MALTSSARPTKVALVLTLGAVDRLARVRRNVEVLLDLGYAVDIVSPFDGGSLPIRRHHRIAADPDAKRTLSSLPLASLALGVASGLLPAPPSVAQHFARRFGLSALRDAILAEPFDVAVVEEVELLPFALSLVGRAEQRVVVDLRDFNWDYPTPTLKERLGRRRLQALYRSFLPRATDVVVVSDGQREQVRQAVGVEASVVLSAPWYQEMSPSALDGDRVRLVYHGRAERDRMIEVLIDAVGSLDDRFTLDLLLMPADPVYLEELKARGGRVARIRFPDPVPQAELIRFANGYDVGVVFYPPTTSNVATALPNKVFEYVQSRLIIATGPTPDIAGIVHRYGCGVVARDFSSEALVEALRRLDAAGVAKMKLAAEVASGELCFEHQVGVLARLLGGSGAVSGPGGAPRPPGHGRANAP